MAGDWSPWVPILKVADARASAAFYCDVLGFQLDWEHQFGEGFPLYMQVSRDPLFLHLSEHSGGIAEGDFFVRVPDVDAVYGEIVERGHQPPSAPIDQEYGMRDFRVVDPDGHNITLGSVADFPTELHVEPGSEEGSDDDE